VGPSYLYRFSYVMSLLQFRRPSATHGSEIPFVFESFTTQRLSDVDRRVQTMMHGCWVAFAKTGKPECPGAPAWPAYERASDQWMVLDATPRVERIPDGAAMDLLRATLDAEGK
jgi:para-nitrobenzyl esterase